MGGDSPQFPFGLFRDLPVGGRAPACSQARKPALPGNWSDLPSVIPAEEGVDFRYGNRSLPLKKGGQEGFGNGSFKQIPLNPPFSKGEAAAIPPAVHLSTASEAGIQGAAILPPHLDTRFRGYDGIGSTSCPTAPDFRAKPRKPKRGGHTWARPGEQKPRSGRRFYLTNVSTLD
jgi:hypothetical protein